MKYKLSEEIFWPDRLKNSCRQFFCRKIVYNLVQRILSNRHIDLSDFSSAAPPSYAMHKNYTVYHFPLAAFKFHFYLSFLPYLHFAPSGGHKYVLEQPFCYTDTAVWMRHTPYFLSMRKSFQPRSSPQCIQQFLS